MCIIASIPAGENIGSTELKAMWENNPDGGGIAYIEDGKVRTYKTMKQSKFKRNFERIVDEYGDSDILVHTRIATHGSICIPNVHPFRVLSGGVKRNDLVFAHNGILPSAFIPPAKMDISDTRYINEMLFNHTDLDAVLDDEAWRDMLGDIIGHNKFVFLSASRAHKRESYIINSHLGQYDGRVWYSNSSYCRPKYVKTYSTGTAWNGYKPQSRSDWDINTREDGYIDMTTGEIVYYDDDNSDDYIKQERRAIAAEGLTYDKQLLEDPSFVRTWETLQANTGYQTIEDAMDGLWADIDENGIWRCFDCDKAITVTGVRTCDDTCNVGDFIADASEYEAAAEVAKKDYKASKKANKIKNLKSMIANSEQTKLYLGQEPKDDTLPF